MKKRRIINGLLWIPLLFLTVVSCFAQQTDTDESRLTIYKVNNTETSLVTESVKRNSTDLRETVEQIIAVFGKRKDHRVESYGGRSAGAAF